MIDNTNTALYCNSAIRHFGLKRGALAVLVRFDSKRLPFKAWRRIGEHPSLEYLLRRLRLLPLPIAIITTPRAIDRPLVLLAKRAGCSFVNTYAGSPNDVLGRLLHGVEKMGWHYAVRISGDSPLIHAELIANIIQQWYYSCDSTVDVFTTVWPQRTTPSGLSVEIVKSDALKILAQRIDCPLQREHVTMGFYQNPNHYNIKSVKKCAFNTLENLPLAPRINEKLSLDTIADYHRIKYLIESDITSTYKYQPRVSEEHTVTT